MNKDKRYNHSFARTLTRWLMAVLFIMMSALGYVVYEMTKSLVVGVTANTFHTNMQSSARLFGGAMSDVSSAARCIVYEVEERLGQPAKLQATLDRMVSLNPRVRKCEIEYVGETVAADSAYWSQPFLDADGVTPLVAYVQPLHDREGRVVAVMRTSLALDFMTRQLEVQDSLFEREVWVVPLTDDEMFKSYVLLRDGRYVTHHDNYRILKGNFFAHVKDAEMEGMASTVIEEMSKGERSSRESDKAVLVNRERCYLFYAPMDDVDWVMAVSVPTVSIEFYGILVGITMLLVITIVLIVTFFVCHLTIKHAARPLKQLAATADEVAGGQFDTVLPVMKSHDEIHLLRDSFENMQHSLTAYVEELKAATAATASMESELKIAHDIQMSMLPKTYPAFPERHDLDIYGFMIPAKAVGGDLYDFFIQDEKLMFCIGDVSGKGVPASLLMAVTRFLFRNIASYTKEPNNICIALNEALSSNNDTGMFVTLFVGVLDLGTGWLSFSNAGHNPPLIVGGEGTRTLGCDANIPVGVMPGWSFTAQHVELHRGDIVFLYTDGLNEAENSQQQLFGTERIEEVTKEEVHGAQQLIEVMAKAVQHFTGDAEQSDDLTMLAVKLCTVETKMAK